MHCEFLLRAHSLFVVNTKYDILFILLGNGHKIDGQTHEYSFTWQISDNDNMKSHANIVTK